MFSSDTAPGAAGGRPAIASLADVSLAGLFGLEDEIVAITGGGGQICGVLALAIAKLGGKVAVLDIDAAAAAQVAAAIAADGGKAIAVPCDVMCKDQARTDGICSLAEAHRRITDELGAPTVLINGAGGNFKAATVDPQAGQPFESVAPETIERALALNVKSAIYACQVFGPPMIAARRGVILDVSSMCAFTPLTKVAFYSMAKAALQNFTQWYAAHICTEYCREGVRVVAIAPGFVLTGQNRFLLTDGKDGFTPRGQAIVNATPMGRLGTPLDLVGPAIFLISKGAQFITGTVLPVDGGFHALSI